MTSSRFLSVVGAFALFVGACGGQDGGKSTGSGGATGTGGANSSGGSSGTGTGGTAGSAGTGGAVSGTGGQASGGRGGSGGSTATGGAGAGSGGASGGRCSRDFGIWGLCWRARWRWRLRRRGCSRDFGSGGSLAGRGGGPAGGSRRSALGAGASTGGSSGTGGGGAGEVPEAESARGSEQRLWHHGWREDADDRRLVGHERSSHVDQTQDHERRNESRIHHRHSGELRSDAPVSPDLLLAPGVWFGHRQCEWPTSRQ